MRSSVILPMVIVALLAVTGCKKKVPDLSGLTQQEAEDTLKKKNLKVGAITVAKKGQQPGTVVGQTPAAGEKLPEDGTIALVFEEGGGVVPTSGGTGTTGGTGGGTTGGGTSGAGSGSTSTVATVPNLKGMTQADAEAALTKAELIRGTLDVVVNDQPEGKVFFTDPPEGTQVAKGTLVNLKIASSTTVPVPKVVDLAQAAAEQKIKDAQLAVGDVTPIITSSGTPGNVVEQSPDPDVRVAKGQPVRLKVKQPSVRVPRVVGMNRKDAQIALFQNGLTPVIRWTFNPNLPPNQEDQILTQTVPEGTEVAKESQVGLEAVTTRRIIGPRIWMRVDRIGNLTAVQGATAIRSLEK